MDCLSHVMTSRPAMGAVTRMLISASSSFKREYLSVVVVKRNLLSMRKNVQEALYRGFKTDRGARHRRDEVNITGLESSQRLGFAVERSIMVSRRARSRSYDDCCI